MFNINSNAPMYDPVAVQPMRDELIYVGFEEALTPEAIDKALDRNDGKTVFVVINSVCGCAAGSARPGVTKALQHSKIPDILVTSFAGQDKEAVAYLRNKYLSHIPPSSPFMALFQNKEIKFVLPRHHIEGRSPEEISKLLTEAFDEFCIRQGPSIPKEDYEKLVHAIVCGSKIPLNKSN